MKTGYFPYSCIFLLPFSFGALAAGGSLFGNNNAAVKPLFGQTAGTGTRYVDLIYQISLRR